MTSTFTLTAPEIERDTVTVGSKLYFVYHGVEGRPVSLIARTGRTNETYHRAGESMASPVETVTHYEFSELPVHSPLDHDTVVRAWEFQRDLYGFEAEAYAHDSAEQLSSAMTAYVEMIRSRYAQRMTRLPTGYWTTYTFVPAPAEPECEDCL